MFGISRGDNGKFTVELKESTEYFDAIILATGSKADGHEFAQTLGHTIVKPVPSLFTLNTKHQVKEGGMLHGLSGISVPTARLTFKVDVEGKKKKQVVFQEGPLLVTHNGISGPATLRLSAFGARQFHQANYQGNVFVHWAPGFGYCRGGYSHVMGLQSYGLDFLPTVACVVFSFLCPRGLVG